MKKDIILIGGGGHCHSSIDVIEAEGKYRILGILELPELVGSKIMDYEVIGTDDDITRFATSVGNFLITVGQIKSHEKRKQLFEKVKNAGGILPVIISPLAYVSKSSKIGEGTIVMHHALINANVKVGMNCIINSKALIEHDSVIGNHCHISTGSIINGNVVAGDGVFFGSGAVSVQGSVIPPGSFVRAKSLYYRK
jgi:sugar O-acyltransferase (sialic acid O-acetyltransferase NeuD family)